MFIIIDGTNMHILVYVLIFILTYYIPTKNNFKKKIDSRNVYIYLDKKQTAFYRIITIIMKVPMHV